jgi:hypothetical protein
MRMDYLNNISTGLAGFTCSIITVQLSWFNTSALHDLAGAFAQLTIAFVTIYTLYKKSKKDEREN